MRIFNFHIPTNIGRMTLALADWLQLQPALVDCLKSGSDGVIHILDIHTPNSESVNHPLMPAMMMMIMIMMMIKKREKIWELAT